MNIMITGSTGFIGRHLVRRLSQDHSLFTPDRGFFASCADQELKEALIRKKIEVVIHLATHFVRNHTEKDLAQLHECNIVLGTRILDAMKALPSAWFINTGSCAEHTGPNYDRPYNLYSETKAAFQKILSASSSPHVTLTLFDTYGPGDTRDKVLNVIHQSSMKKIPLDMSPGEQRLEMCFVDDVVSAYERTLTLLENEEMRGKIFGIPGERVSLKCLVDTYERATGNKTRINWGALPYRSGELMEPWQGFRTLPGFSPRFSLEEGIRKTFAADS